MDGLTDFQSAINEPGNYARGLKDQGKKVIGYFCSYTPEEIIHAAGFHPIRLFGGQGEITLADAHLQSYCCSLVKGGLEQALAGDLAFLDGTVFPHTCDTIQRLSDIWRLNTDFGFFADVVLPVKLNTKAAREYMVDVLAKFRRELADGMGVEISDDALNSSFAIYNRIRSGLEKLYALRSENPGCIGGHDLYTIVKGSMIMDRDAVAKRLPEIIDEVKAGKYAWKADGHKRLMLIGGICDHPDVYRALEDAGGVVVYDDLCTGSRFFEGQLSEDGDPVAALAGRMSDRPICAAKHASNTYRGDRVVELAKEKNVDGAIFVLLKFCDPHAFDYPYMKEFLDKAGVSNMLYEIDEQSGGLGQMSTRFETFIQMLQG